MYIASKILFLLILCLSLTKTAEAYRPDGHLGCYEDERDRILNGESRNSDTNSGDECKAYCKSHGYRYAGTEYANECFCGNDIRKGKKAVGCNSRCSGNPNEFCGGSWLIDIYDTWSNTSTTFEQTATKPSTTTTVAPSISFVTDATTSSFISSESMNQFSTSIKGVTNTSNLPEIIKDDTDDFLIAMYVLLPFAVIILFVVTALFLMRRRRRRKKDEVPEVIYHGPGSLPNIYANLTVTNNNLLGYENHLKKNETGKSKVEVKEKDNITNARQEMEDSVYNFANVRLNNSHGHTTSIFTYDHIPMFMKPAYDKTYSQLAAANLEKDHAIIQNTYSHIDECSGNCDVRENAENDDVTYNRLEMKGTSKTGIRKNPNIEESSEYDHAVAGQTFAQLSEADDYSHINGVTFKTQTTGHDNNVCQLAVKNEIVDEDEYSTVMK